MFLFYKKRSEKICFAIALLLFRIFATFSARDLPDRINGLISAKPIWEGIRAINRGYTPRGSLDENPELLRVSQIKQFKPVRDIARNLLSNSHENAIDVGYATFQRRFLTIPSRSNHLQYHHR